MVFIKTLLGFVDHLTHRKVTFKLPEIMWLFLAARNFAQFREVASETLTELCAR